MVLFDNGYYVVAGASKDRGPVRLYYRNPIGPEEEKLDYVGQFSSYRRALKEIQNLGTILDPKEADWYRWNSY